MTNKILEKEILKDEGQYFSSLSIWRKGKSGRIRLKKMADLAKEAAEILGSMANSDGGTLIIKSYPAEKISSRQIPEKLFVDIFDKVKKLLQPEPCMRFLIGKTTKGMILKMDIEKSPVPIGLEDGRYLFRFGKKSYPIGFSDLSLLKREKLKILFEREFMEGASIQDLDDRLINKFCTMAGLKGKPFDVLKEKFGLLEYKGEEEKITRSALLLFSHYPEKWHPRAGVDFIKFDSGTIERSQKETIAERIRIESPLMKLVDQIFEVVGNHIKERKTFYDLFTVEKNEYPTFAWKEAILNALIHRDYSILGSPIEILMYDDRLEIRSPGLLPEPLSLAHINKKEGGHISRNPIISRVFWEAGYIRERGTGIQGIFEDMENNDLSPPEFREEGFMFCVILRNTPIFDEKTQAWLSSFNDLYLNSRQKRILAWAFNHAYRFSSKDYQRLGRVDRDQAYREILDLEKRHLVHPEGKGRYKISQEKL